MSLLWRKQLRISLGADRLVLRANRSRTRTVPVQSDPGPEWRAAVQALPAVLAEFRNHDVSLVLADQFVRYVLMAGSPAVKTEAQWLDLARHRLATVHGAAAAEWELKLTETAPAGPRLACAVDRALVDAIAALFAATGARLVSVEPFLVAAFNRIRRTIGGGSCWLVIEEPGRLTLAFIQQGVWVAVRSRRADRGWRAALPELIERESAFLALAQPCTRVVVCAQGDFDTGMYEAFRTQAVDYKELALAWSDA